MADRLTPYTLSYDEKQDDWQLRKDGADRATRRFATKEEATQGGVLEEAIGSAGGSVKIQKKTGQFQEERTFPRSRDPRRSPG